MAQQTVSDAGLDFNQIEERELRLKRWQKTLDRFQPLLYLLPAVFTIGLWIYRPLVNVVWLSFYQWNLLPTTPREWVGFDNYVRIATLPDMRQAVLNTVVYIVGILPFSVIIPLGIAIVTHSMPKRSRNFYRALIFTPMIMAPVVVSLIWRWILHPTHGVVNELLVSPFSDEPIFFFQENRLAIWTIIFITGWKLIGFSMLIFSAAITNVNPHYLEAASIDGATYWQSVFRIILPLMSPTILLMIMLSVLLVSQWSFAYINVLTQGGRSVPRQMCTTSSITTAFVPFRSVGVVPQPSSCLFHLVYSPQGFCV